MAELVLSLPKEAKLLPNTIAFPRRFVMLTLSFPPGGW
jgi:hypothetical protein